MQIHAALLALHTNRPVKMVYNREESFTGPRPPASGADLGRAPRDARGAARLRADANSLDGAYASTAVTANAASFACGPTTFERLDRVDERLHEQQSSNT